MADVTNFRTVSNAVGRRFDATYYLAANRDVAESGMDPLAHFILSGMVEGRAPNSRETDDNMLERVSEMLGRLPTQDDLLGIHSAYKSRSSLSGFGRSLVRRALARIAGKRAKRRTSRVEATPALNVLLDVQAFNVLNAAGLTFSKPSEALAYLLKTGFETLDPLDFHLKPDPAFVQALYPKQSNLDDASLYLDWLKHGQTRGEFISESHLLRHAGSNATHILDHFPAEDYRAAYSDVPLRWSKEQLLLHFLTSGIREGRFSIPIGPELLTVVEDCILHLANRDPSRAGHAAERLLLTGTKSPRLAILVAQNALKSGQLMAARSAIRDQSSDVPVEKVLLSQLTADLLRRQGKEHQAAEPLANIVRLDPGSVWAERELASVVGQAFESSRLRAKRLSDMGNLAASRTVLENAIAHAYDGLLPYGSSSQRGTQFVQAAPLDKRPLRVGMFSDLFLPQCKLYRVDQKIEQLEAAGATVSMFDFRKDAKEAIDKVGLYDVWIIYRVPAFFDALRLVRAANALGRPTLYEIDDLLFDTEHFPEPIQAYGGNLSLEEYRGLQLSTVTTAGLARRCTHGLASTETLAHELSKLVSTGKVLVHHNALSSPHFTAIQDAAHNQNVRSGNTVRIFYGSGTKAHKDFLEDVFFAALDEVMTARPNVEFHAIGYVNAVQLKTRHAARIIESPPLWDTREYWAKLAEADINVAVLKRQLLTDSKSEIKWMEAAMLGIPSVVSGTTTLRDAIDDGRTGLIADTREEWVSQLLKLVDEAPLRRNMGDAARDVVMTRYAIAPMSQNLLAELSGLVRPTTEVAPQ